METRNVNIESSARKGVISSPPQAAAGATGTRTERPTADALIAPDRDPSGPLSDPGALEYASWLRMLRRATP